ncbi:CHAT domain-containing protein [Amycolatopsis pithecellobii]|uniref:CHAT domain-containing protein n=1 Tax=Amycolatopsis pithecellobii TaxID=664692 RepID=A0A6N7Z005_9PSEU|nr:CHAT domain-containing protein [Amycolatopsis pithecellobii]MTD57552.1 CHAT domain-containing protein [Amycolatopsis pithecellobii]
MRERAKLLRRVKARVSKFERTGDPSHILDREATAEAAELLAQLGNATDIAVISVAASFYEARFQVRPRSDEGAADGSTAVTLYAQLYPTHPELVPELYRDFLEKNWARIERSAGTANDDLMRDARAAQQLFTRDPASRTRADLEEALALQRRALRLLPAVHPGYAATLSEKAVVLVMLCDESADPRPLLEEAEASHREALAAAPPGHASRATILCNFGLFLKKWYIQTNLAEVPAEAVRVGRELVDLVEPDQPDALTMLYGLGDALRELFELSGEADLLEVSLALLTKSVDAYPPFSPGLSSIFFAISRAQFALYQVNGDQQLLSDAASAAVGAATIAPHEQPDPAAFAHHAMTVQRELYRVRNDTDALADAVRHGQTALRLTPKTDPNHAVYQDNLLHVLMDQYSVTKEVSLLQRAAAAGRDGVAAAAPDHPARGLLLHDLSYVLYVLYQAEPSMGVLREAIRTAREAIAAGPADAPDRAGNLVTLGAMLRILFTRTGEVAAVHEAIEVTSRALDALPAGTPKRAQYLGNLAMIRFALFEQQPDTVPSVTNPTTAVLAQAIAEAREALAGSTGAELTRNRSNLSVLLAAAGTDEALSEALALAREATVALPQGAEDTGVMFAQLGRCLRLSVERSGNLALVGEARKAFTTAERASRAAQLRIWAKRQIAWADLTEDDPGAAMRAYGDAIDLLTEVSAPRFWRQDRQAGLAGLSGLAAEAATAAIRAGDPAQAVDLLERARGTLLAEAMGWRGDQAELAARAPELAEEYAKLRDSLELAEEFNHTPPVILEVPGLDAPVWKPEGIEFDRDGSPEQLAAWITAWRRELERWRDDLLGRIRAVDGLADFQRAPSTGEPPAGPVVMIAVSEYGAHALIVTDEPPRVVPLPGLTPEKVREQVDRLLRVTGDAPGRSAAERMRAQRDLSDLVGWLWDVVAEPVLDELGFTGPADRDGPRVWWCPAGELALLPIHAAGHHDREADGAPPTVLDRVVSSYTPTLRALRHARAVEPPEDTAAGALIVAMPQTPGAAPLPGVLAEAARIEALVPGSRMLTGPAATTAAVSEGLRSHWIAHLACHGINDRSNPDASRLLLHDHEENPFTVHRAGTTRPGSAGLAYLSACSTTQSSPWLADEALHITSAFQLAGYPHVIGTLWPVGDAVATRVAGEVYTTLTEGGTPQPDRSPYALHEAIRRLRDDYVASPSLWAAHIHAGL